MTKAIMIQGAGSNVGKSMIVAGLCRHFTNQGLRVLPFKPQNMSNNAAVTADGGEIGRAQALQARACRVDAQIDMNPVLLKPETETGAQVVVHGKRLTTLKAREYASLKPTLIEAVLASFHRLKAQADLVIVEGAGSPAEVNLRKGDIANMGFAEAADCPVILTGDIDRGGVIAQLVGSYHVLSEDDRNRIAGFMVNKFRGDLSLFDGGRAEIVKHTGWADIGTLPWFDNAHLLPAEDAADLSSAKSEGRFKIAVPKLSRIANFDDLDPLNQEPDVAVELVQPGSPLPADADLVLIPGSKSTIGDLAYFRAQGWDIDLAAHIRRGGQVLGICGGYQMLGREIHDPQGIEGAPGSVEGLGHLDVVTEMTPKKRLAEIKGHSRVFGAEVAGYEIHIGRTSGPDCARAWLDFDGRADGAASQTGQVRGCYVHGLFAEDGFRKAFLGAHGSDMDFAANVDGALDQLAGHVATYLDCPKLLDLAR